ncbi:hypothetical protein D9613_005594 [Agrocybe pediades]|uniref:Uncharacterized protein n=1 Tax=Agrocybe pediades TaxID=84607 RepID=A0A8H4QXQ7_9AGAR|nr:hypothetical protein D9613_005594 [Agrocybe pediades]
MRGRVLANSVLAPISHSIKPRTQQAYSHLIRPSSTLATLEHQPSASDPSSSRSTPFYDLSDSLSYEQRVGLRDLINAVETNPSPHHIWANYVHVVALLGSQTLPVEIHQQVLRRCSPPKEYIKEWISKKMADKGDRVRIKKPTFESRFRTVITNIRNSGFQPSLDDYNYVLQQLAVTAHYRGVFNVYEEIKRSGQTPNQTTYAACFQAMAYRLTLPIHPRTKQVLVPQMQTMFKLYMSEMRHFKIPMSAACLDFGLRVLKYTLDSEGFESIMRSGYGIDLSNPDRVALEYQDTASKDQKPEMLLAPFPFTTTALNTTIDMLGILGNVSKMVQAFEVLTQPLPQANQHFFNTFESDEDDDFGVSVDVSSPSRIPPPYAEPNTTTYNILLRHICAAGHATFARHYLVQAMRLDGLAAWNLQRTVDFTLKKQRPLNSIAAPHFAVNRNMFLTVMGETNRDKNLGLLKWLSTKFPRILKRQRDSLKHYKDLRQRLLNAGVQLPSTTMAHRRPPVPPVLDVDIEASPEVPQTKPFNLNLHINILERNVYELQGFERRLEAVLGRTSQRTKERLGRRVWEGKNVYLATQGVRTTVSKDRWRQIVNFKPRTDGEEQASAEEENDEDEDRPRREFNTSRRRYSSTRRTMSTFASIFYPNLRPLVSPTPVLTHRNSEP